MANKAVNLTDLKDKKRERQPFRHHSATKAAFLNNFAKKISTRKIPLGHDMYLECVSNYVVSTPQNRCRRCRLTDVDDVGQSMSSMSIQRL